MNKHLIEEKLRQIEQLTKEIREELKKDSPQTLDGDDGGAPHPPTPPPPPPPPRG